MFKKFLSVMTSLLLVVGLVACGGSSSGQMANEVDSGGDGLATKKIANVEKFVGEYIANFWYGNRDKYEYIISLETNSNCHVRINQYHAELGANPVLDKSDGWNFEHSMNYDGNWYVDGNYIYFIIKDNIPSTWRINTSTFPENMPIDDGVLLDNGFVPGSSNEYKSIVNYIG